MASRPIEEQALREFLDSASSTPSALLVDGEAGIGKTTLWLAGLEQARGRCNYPGLTPSTELRCVRCLLVRCTPL